MRPSCPLLLALQLQPVSDHGDELRIGWLALGGIHRVSKVLLQGFQVAPIPCYLNGVAMARSTRLGVVEKRRATSGYSTLVTALMTSMSSTASKMASRRY